MCMILGLIVLICIIMYTCVMVCAKTFLGSAISLRKYASIG